MKSYNFDEFKKKNEPIRQELIKIDGKDAPRAMMRAVREIVVDTSLHLYKSHNNHP